ncbi:Peptidase family M13 [Nesidiocoris tenuis]|uniref:Peptidase family M13 n=1 Tax=Nesidiocoris tenuis TaxID=355587 RepID=A0ABN7BC06_9HEMI|nr:Peptidase family M13 [Nesidiocoris tenuis]
MEQSNNDHIPRTVSNDNSIWTVDGSQQQLASTNTSKSDNISLFNKLPRKRLESYLTLSLLGILLLLLTLVVMIYLVINSSVIFTKVCYSTNCVRSAANLLESMNASANPCDNFFKYACGKWKTNHAGPEPYWSNSWFIDRSAIQKRDVIQFLSKKDDDDDPQGVKDARKVFLACLDIDAQDETGIELLFELLDKIGLPRNPLNRTANATPWIEILARTKRFLSMDLFIASGVMPSIANSTLNQLVLSTVQDDEILPGWNWERRKFHSDIRKKLEAEEEQGSDATIGIWTKFGSRLISYLIEETGEAFEDSDVVKASENILYIIRNVSALEESENVTGSILNEVPIEFTLEDLQSLINNGTANGSSKLDLAQYFTTLYDSLSESEPDFAEDKLLVYKKAYFPLLSEYLETMEDGDINLYIWWNVVYTLAAHTNDDLRQLKENLVRKISFDSPSETRAGVCMQTVYSLMSQALGYFIAQRFEESRINEVYSMIYNIRDTFISYINRIKWMDQETKRASIDKLRNFKVFVGIPDWMRNRTEFEDLYSNVSLSEENHFENVMNLLDSIMISDLESLRRTNDHDVGEFDPLDINAYYEPSANTIIVPYGILQFPFYDLGLEALNYGAIGTVLGHEMTHGFDNTGRRFDKYGNVHPWWSNQSIEKYTNRTACFETEYSDFTLPNVNSSLIKIDGKLTLGENLADDGGLKFGFNAYRTYVANHGIEAKLPGLQAFTHDQLFFLSFANVWCSEFSLQALYTALEDEHSPDFARVLVVLQNSPEFSEAFKCPRGSYMNPDHKCKLWTR